jgi:hypothetical protein
MAPRYAGHSSAPANTHLPCTDRDRALFAAYPDCPDVPPIQLRTVHIGCAGTVKITDGRWYSADPDRQPVAGKTTPG